MSVLRGGIIVDGATNLCVTRTRIQVPTSDPALENHYAIYGSGATNIHISMNLFNAQVFINGISIPDWNGFNVIEAGRPVY